MIAAASTNGGTRDRVHAEFANGYIFAVRNGENYIPVVFDVVNAFGENNPTVLAAGAVYHDRLMRRDGGPRLYTKKITPVFDWSELRKVQIGTSECDDEGNPIFGFELNRARNAAICGLDFYISKLYRCDRNFWNPGKTVQNATGQSDLFGVKQTDPRACAEPSCSHAGKCKANTWKNTWASEVACEDCA